MKILNITAQKPDSTGSGVYLAEMVNAFDALGHEQAVIAGIDFTDTYAFPPNILFEPVLFNTPKLPFPVAGMSDEMPYPATKYSDMTKEMVNQFEKAFHYALGNVLDEFMPDLVICHHLYLLTSIVRQALPNAKVLAICHSTDIRQMRKHKLERPRILQNIPKLDAIYALHDVQKEEIVEVYCVPSSLVTVLGTGYNAQHFNGDCKRERSGSDPTIQLVFVGKIWEKKGVHSLIRSLEHLTHPHNQLSLHLIGGHNSEEELERAQELANLSKYPVHFHGRVSQEALISSYRNADVFVLPSFYEGLPLVVIEAMACGCKIVVSDLPGIRPWLEAQVGTAPIFYVKTPSFINTDEVELSELPAFEERLAQAIDEAIKSKQKLPVMHHLSWENLCKRLLAYNQIHA